MRYEMAVRLGVRDVCQGSTMPSGATDASGDERFVSSFCNAFMGVILLKSLEFRLLP
jgi:hypothetical protein